MSGSEKHTAVPARERTARATLLVALSACGFGSISTLTLVVTRAGTPLVPAMFWRYLAASVVMIVAVVSTRVVHTPPRRALALLGIGGVGQALITYLSLRALDYISVAPLAFLFYTYPAWVTLVAAARGVDRITPVRAVALGLALAGVATIIGSPVHARLDPIGIALALAAAVSYGIYLPAVSSAQRGVDPIASAALIIVGATVAFGIVAAATGTLHAPVPPRAALAIVALALLSTVAAFWLLLAGLATLGPVRTAIVATVEPFFTMMLGVLVLGDAVSVRTGIGGALIATAVVLIQRTGARGADDR